MAMGMARAKKRKPDRGFRWFPAFGPLNFPASRLLPVLAVAIVLAAVVVASGLASASRSRNPGLALMLAPWDARAKAKQADLLLAPTKGQKPRYREASALARSALARDATLPGAWRVLGLEAASAGDARRASRLIKTAETMSRRDLPTQAWLIEERVAAGDIAGALRHYDLALRGSSAATNVLMPILVSASSDPAIAAPLRQLLLRPSPWRRDFLRRLADAPDADIAASLIEAAASTEGRPLPDVYFDLGNHYINLKKFDAGLRVLHVVASGRGPVPLVRDGGFNREPRYPPYDWKLADTANPSVQLMPGNDQKGQRLHTTATSGNGGILAEQLLALKPGRYMLEVRRGTPDGVAPAQVNVQIACAKAGAPLADLPLNRARNVLIFDQPNNKCAAQWLRIALIGDFSATDTGAWVDDIVVRQAK